MTHTKVAEEDSETESDDNDNPLGDWNARLETECMAHLKPLDSLNASEAMTEHHATEPESMPLVGDAALPVAPDKERTGNKHQPELEDELHHYMELIDNILQPSSCPSSPGLQSISAMDSNSPMFKAL